MTKETWILVDCNYFGWRAFHSMQGLKFGGVGTGVVFGFMKDMRTLMQQHNTTRMAFCFDLGKGLRTKDSAGYKQTRRNRKVSEEDRQAYNDMRRQMEDIRTKHLPAIGFQNVFSADGYEADDLIASLCKHSITKKQEAVIASADQDLYQLLRENIMIWNPPKKEMITAQKFEERYGISPAWWSSVKAIAGCKSDDVIGVEGVGETYAIKYITGVLSKTSKKHEAIKTFVHTPEYETNRKLTKLPYPMCPQFKLTEDKVTDKKWRDFAKILGFSSMEDRVVMKGKGFGFQRAED